MLLRCRYYETGIHAHMVYHCARWSGSWSVEWNCAIEVHGFEEWNGKHFHFQAIFGLPTVWLFSHSFQHQSLHIMYLKNDPVTFLWCHLQSLVSYHFLTLWKNRRWSNAYKCYVCGVLATNACGLYSTWHTYIRTCICMYVQTRTQLWIGS